MKQVIAFIFAVLMLCFLNLPAQASEEAEQFVEDYLEQWNEQLEELIPTEAEELLEELEYSELSLRQLLSLEPGRFFSLFRKELKQQWKAPFAAFGKITGILLLAAMLNPLQHSLLKEENNEAFQLSSALCLALVFAEPVTDCIRSSMTALSHCASFLLALLPILCTVLIVGGQAVTASAYQLFLFGSCQLISQLAVSTAVPLLGIYFVLSMVFSLFPTLNAQTLTVGIRNFICWGLGIVCTIFVALLSLQTFVTANVDVITLKASRFLMGSFIPVIGSILSEAFAAAQGCVSLLRASVGSFAVVVALCTILPVLLRVILWYFLLWAAHQLSQLLELGSLSALLKSTGNTFAILLAMLCCFLLLILVAAALLIFIGTGG